jgi:hypothetical protein
MEYSELLNPSLNIKTKEEVLLKARKFEKESEFFNAFFCLHKFVLEKEIRNEGIGSEIHFKTAELTRKIKETNYNPNYENLSEKNKKEIKNLFKIIKQDLHLLYYVHALTKGHLESLIAIKNQVQNKNPQNEYSEYESYANSIIKDLNLETKIKYAELSVIEGRFDDALYWTLQISDESYFQENFTKIRELGSGKNQIDLIRKLNKSNDKIDMEISRELLLITIEESIKKPKKQIEELPSDLKNFTVRSPTASILNENFMEKK